MDRYIKTNWENDKTRVDAMALNNIENGVAELMNIKTPKLIEDINNKVNKEYVDENLEKINTSLDNKTYELDIKKANKEDVARLSSGTPLFASNTSGMTDTTKNYVNTTDGYLYSYIGGVWTKTSVQYQSTGIDDYSVTHKKTNFMNEGLNIYNPNLAQDGKLSGYQNGVIIDYADGASSGKIPVSVGTYNFSIAESENGFDTIFRCYGESSYIGVSKISGTAPVASGITSSYKVANGRKQQIITITNPLIKYIETSIIHPYVAHDTSYFDRVRKSIQFQKGEVFEYFEAYTGKGILDYNCLPIEVRNIIENTQLNKTLKVIKNSNDFF